MLETGWFVSTGGAAAAAMVEASGNAPLWLQSSVISGIIFAVQLPFGQFAGKAVKVSCATPVCGKILGFAAVAVTSVDSALVANAIVPHPQLTIENFQDWLCTRKIFLQAVVGLLAFKALGGKFRNLMPSDVLYPGALARVSIPARGISYASDVEKAIINDLFKQFGCHHCGKRTGESISDHMPPNLTVHGPRKLMSKSRGPQKTDQAAGQRLYPQCRDCIKLQSTALRHRGPSLVLHWKRGWPEPFSYAGFFLGSAYLNDTEDQVQDVKVSSTGFPDGASVRLVRETLQEVGPARLKAIQQDVECLRFRDKEIQAEQRRILREKFFLRYCTWGLVRAGSEEEVTLRELTAELDRNAKLKGKLKEEMRWLQDQPCQSEGGVQQKVLLPPVAPANRGRG